MLGEILRELTKVKIGSVITSEDVLAWAKRVEAQRLQAAVMNSLTETKEFDKIKIAKNTCKENLRSSTQMRIPMKQMCRYCESSHPQDNVYHTGRHAQTLVRLAISEWYSEAYLDVWLQNSFSCCFHKLDLKETILLFFLTFCFDHWLYAIVFQFQNAVHVCVALLSTVCFLLCFSLLGCAHVCTALAVSGIQHLLSQCLFFLC